MQKKKKCQYLTRFVRDFFTPNWGQLFYPRRQQQLLIPTARVPDSTEMKKKVFCLDYSSGGGERSGYAAKFFLLTQSNF